MTRFSRYPKGSVKQRMNDFILLTCRSLKKIRVKKDSSRRSTDNSRTVTLEPHDLRLPNRKRSKARDRVLECRMRVNRRQVVS
jgi:hypothetical protein